MVRGRGKIFIFGLVLTGLMAAGFSGALLESQILEDSDGNQEWVWEWTPETEDFGYMMKIETQNETNCLVTQTIKGRLTHESGIGAYRVVLQDWGVSTGSTSRIDDSVHVGPVNTAQVAGPVIGQAGSYESNWSRSTHGGWLTAIQIAFSVSQPYTPLRVECDGPDAQINFFLPDAIEPIMSSSSSGGVGVELWSLPLLPTSLGVNIGDQYTIDTKGNDVFFIVQSAPNPFIQKESNVEGELRITTPSEEEVIPLEVDEETDRLTEMRFWSEPGRYEIELDRFAENRRPLKGMLVGFVLEEQVGSL